MRCQPRLGAAKPRTQTWAQEPAGKHPSLRAEPHREHPNATWGHGEGVSWAPSGPVATLAGSAHPCPPLLAAESHSRPRSQGGEQQGA